MIEGAEGNIIGRAAIVDDIDREVQLFQLFGGQIGGGATVREFIIDLVMLVILLRIADVGDAGIVDVVLVGVVVVDVGSIGIMGINVVGFRTLVINNAINDLERTI